MKYLLIGGLAFLVLYAISFVVVGFDQVKKDRALEEEMKKI